MAGRRRAQSGLVDPFPRPHHPGSHRERSGDRARVRHRLLATHQCSASPGDADAQAGRSARRAGVDRAVADRVRHRRALRAGNDPQCIHQRCAAVRRSRTPIGVGCEPRTANPACHPDGTTRTRTPLPGGCHRTRGTDRDRPALRCTLVRARDRPSRVVAARLALTGHPGQLGGARSRARRLRRPGTDAGRRHPRDDRLRRRR